MADEKSSLHIDSDWKKQAQEEKRKLAEQAAAKPAAAPASAAVAEPAAGGRPRAQQMPGASFATLVQSMLTQALYYLGDLASRGTEPSVNLDMAKYQIDTLAVIEEKTKGNLSDEERRLLDTVLYKARMRYVSVASQYT